MALDTESAPGLLVTGILGGAVFGLVVIGGHFWAVARAGGSAAAPAPVSSNPVDDAAMAGRDLMAPVEGVHREHLKDSFDENRGARVHAALDILAPRDTPVRAVDDGTVARLSSNPGGGTSVEQHDAADEYCYYYAHLGRYADGLRQGQRVTRGQVLGYVGSTGNAAPGAPHLHFAIFKLGPDQRCWTGMPVNPYPLFR